MVHGKQESESDAPSPSSLTLTTRVKRRPCSSRASLQRLSTASCLAQILFSPVFARCAAVSLVNYYQACSRDLRTRPPEVDSLCILVCLEC